MVSRREVQRISLPVVVRSTSQAVDEDPDDDVLPRLAGDVSAEVLGIGDQPLFQIFKYPSIDVGTAAGCLKRFGASTGFHPSGFRVSQASLAPRCISLDVP